MFYAKKRDKASKSAWRKGLKGERETYEHDRSRHAPGVSPDAGDSEGDERVEHPVPRRAHVVRDRVRQQTDVARRFRQRRPQVGRSEGSR